MNIDDLLEDLYKTVLRIDLDGDINRIELFLILTEGFDIRPD